MPPKGTPTGDLQEQLDTLADEFKDLSDDILETYELGLLIQSDKTKEALFSARLSRLDSTYEKFLNCFSKIRQTSKKLQLDTSSYETLNKDSRKHFYESLAVGRTLSQTKAESVGESSFVERSIRDGNSKVRLPTINIPIFSGNISDWPSFKDTFSSLVHDNEDLNDVQKFHYLKSSLKGSASLTIAAINVTAEGYEQAWASLTTRYDSKRLQATHYLMNIFNFPPLNKCSLATLDHFSSVVLESAASFNRLNLSDPAGVILCTFALRLLNPKIRERFETKYGSQSEPPTWKDFSEFVSQLTIQLQSSALIANQKPNQPSGDHIIAQSPKKVLISTETTKECFQCPVCKDSHRIFDCPNFRSMTPQRRFDQIKAFNRCLNCLASGHSVSKCPSASSCRQCNLRHHSLLHFPRGANSHSKATQHQTPSKPKQNKSQTTPQNKKIQPQSPGVSGSSQASMDPSASLPAPTSVLSSTSIDEGKVLLSTVKARIKDSFGVFHQIRVLIDSGSQRSFVTTKCARQLKLPFYQNSHQLVGFGNQSIPGGKYQVSCILVPSKVDTPEHHTVAIVTDHITSEMPSEIIARNVVQNFSHLDLADPSFDQPGPIDFLLGADLFGEILTGELIKSQSGFPTTMKTTFGWILSGPIGSGTTQSTCDTTFLLTSVDDSTNLQHIMTRFWEVEELENVEKANPLEVMSENHFMATHSRTPTGNYVVRLPFRKDRPKLESSRFTALKRFRKLEQKFIREPSLKEEYSKVFGEYQEKGYLSRASQQGACFLPHHGVFKDSTTTKLRIVFDASAPTINGSLNDHLLSGPKLQPEIKDILLNFRLPQFVMTADICQMYLQIFVEPEDRSYLHLFFRSHDTDGLQEFEFNSLPFGLSCSPFLAIRVLQQLVADEGKEFPMASRALLEETYIDDILTGADILEDALILQHELISLLKKGGFALKKWNSNKKELLEPLSITYEESVVSLSSLEDNIVKVLGMQWDPKRDLFTYRVCPREIVSTKRGILSTIARMYDPLGYCAPVIFKAKTILQQLWKAKLEWDEPVPHTISQCWENFFLDLPQLQAISIPRCVKPLHPTNISIVGFADASTRGYAAVLYIRCQDYLGKVTAHLIVAKTRLAPLKLLSVPRLELCAALLLVNLVVSIQPFIKRLDISSTFLFSDSSTVLSWLRTPPYQLKTFVANRVGKILDRSVITNWHHVSSEDNAADIASRGIYPSGLIRHAMWWNGPEWLRRPIEEWPLSESPPVLRFSDLPETKPDHINLTMQDESLVQTLIDRFSSYTKLLRVLAYVTRFVRNSRSRLNRTTGALSLKELNDANNILVKDVQKRHFSELSENSNSKSSLKSLAIFTDSLGIYRVGGRLTNAPLSFDSKHPVLLPTGSHYVNLLVDHFHVIYLHAGPQLLLSLIRRRYWIVSARRLIRSRIHRCLRCHRLKVKNLTPFMGDLPLSRFEQGRPFINTGVDFAGPFSIRESSRRKAALGKAYACLFICMSTKAVHIEIVSKLTSVAFLACLDRFIARRGLPSKIFSDNGTNFIGAARHLRELQDWWASYSVKLDIAHHLNKKEITWSFIPPSAPHFGGLWEAGVKSLKHHLIRVMTDQPLTFEELSTVTSRIEAILNSRPLHPMSSSEEDNDVLTPGHFLIGEPLVALPESDIIDPPRNPVTRWSFLHRCIGDIWKRWRRDYLHCLQQRAKWTSKSPDVAVGTLVLLIEPNVPPLNWPTGRITAVFPGKDGVVRVVKVKTHTTEYMRPVTRLAPLLPA